MARWTAHSPDGADGRFDPATLVAAWQRLHLGDAEPLPAAAAEREAWALFHAGRFEAAVAAGLAAGGSGANAADRAQLAQALYLERRERVRLGLCQAVAERAAARAALRPDDANAHHLFAVALARQLQGAPIGLALAQGLLGRVRTALETTIAIAPGHANAHIALGAFHAEVIDKLGTLIGSTQKASKAQGLAMFRAALKLDPDSVLARLEYARGLLVLEGERCSDQATQLYQEAAALRPRDAAERLEVDIARHTLDE